MNRSVSLASLAPFALFGVALVIAACSSTSRSPAPIAADPSAPPLLGSDCDPIAPTQCGFPFPSNVYLVDGHVAFGKTTLPHGNLGHSNDPAAWRDSDGFSPGQAPMAHLPGATPTGLPTQDAIDRSLGKDSPTVILDAESGERVPHFAELDMSNNDEDTRALMMRPVVRLKDARRYIVAIRRVVDATGAAVAPSPAFKALRDGAPHEHPSVERRRALYADIFAKLAAAGIDKADLQIAWDYTTASRDNNTRSLVFMRDDALAKLGPDGPPYRIASVEENPNPYIRRRLHVMMTVPLYLDKTTPGARLVRGPDGLPKQNGTAEFEVLVHVPNAATRGTPGAPLQNGHGLFGSSQEGQGGYLAQICDKYNMVGFGVDLIGMAGDDAVFIADTLATDIGGFRMSVDRQHQGVLNSLLAMRLMRGAFARDPQVTWNGVSAIDTTKGYYRGDSQGGIFGTTYMALTTDVIRGLLGEPGMPYNLLLLRSTDASGFLLVARATYRNAMDQQIILGLVQMLWDRTEPNGYAPYITKDMLPGTPAHQVLIHAALSDKQVSPLGAHIIARAVGAKSMRPAVRKLFGVDEADAPFKGSAIVEFTFGLPEAPATNVPPAGYDDPHDKVRVLPAAQAQADKFFREGIVDAFCDGICDPE